MNLISGQKFRENVKGIEQYKQKYSEKIYECVRDLKYFERYKQEL